MKSLSLVNRFVAPALILAAALAILPLKAAGA
jgi:hypothetical protein